MCVLMNEPTNDVWELIADLTEEINGLVLRQLAALEVLTKLVPDFAQEFDKAYSDSVRAQQKGDIEAVQEFERKLRIALDKKAN